MVFENENRLHNPLSWILCCSKGALHWSVWFFKRDGAGYDCLLARFLENDYLQAWGSLLNFGNFNFAQPGEGWRRKRNNAVLKNHQSALATSKSNRHKLENSFRINHPNINQYRWFLYLVWSWIVTFYECCRGRQTLSQGRREARSQRRTRSLSWKLFTLLLMDRIYICYS